MMRRLWILQVVTAAILLAGIGAMLILCDRLVQHQRAELVSRTEGDARHIAAQVEIEFSQATESLGRLGTWWLTQGKPLDADDWRSDAQLFLSSTAGLRKAWWIGTDGVARWSAAPGGDPAATESRADSRILEVTALAATKPPVSAMSRLLDEPGIGPAFYLAVPVRTGTRLRGFVVGLYDAHVLMQLVTRALIPHDYRASIEFDGREIYSVAGARSALRSTPAYASIKVLNRNWTLALRGPMGYFDAFKGLILILGTVFSALIYASAMLIFVAQRRSSQLARANRALEDEMRRRAAVESTVRELNLSLNRRITEFQTLLDVIPVGIAVAEDPECRSIWANPALTRMMGVAEDVNISKNVAESAPLYRLCRGGVDLRSEELPMQMAAATGREVLGHEHEIVRADGTTVNVLCFAAPVFDEERKVRGVLNACVDITEQKAREQERNLLMQQSEEAHKEAERALVAVRESEARFHRLIESEVIGVVIVAPDRIVESNRYFLERLGYSSDDLQFGKLAWKQIIPASSRVEDERLTAQLLETGKLAPHERELLTRDGRALPVLVGGALIEQGPEWQAVFFVLDLTARRELEARLRRAQKMKSLGVMAAGIAHDFNGLLTTILGNAELAMVRLPSGSEAWRFLSQVRDAGTRAAGLVHQVLAYTGQSFHVLQSIDIGKIVQEMQETIVHTAGAKAGVNFHLDSVLPPVKADPEEVRQVLLHVVRNAAEAIEEDRGSIDITVALREIAGAQDAAESPDELRPGTYVVLEVKDSGVGMSPEVAARAFDPFFSTKFLGRGLGLSAVLGIMQAHHGTVRLDTAPRRGTRLQLFFPLEGARSGVRRIR